MSTYEKLLFMHFVFVALLVGGEGVATATGIGMSRTSDTRTIEMLARLSSKAEYLALIPGALGTIVTGTWLVDELAYLEFEQGWLTASYVIWAVATAIGTFVLGPHARRVARRAKELRENGVGESEELHAEASKRLIAMLGMLQLVFILALLWLMTAKPGL
ncbi:MAG TPA: DUF2269 family protein [Gaiellaceae bacterium]|nr:DUF2269 family protein [Gaiellaceae bacterium]